MSFPAAYYAGLQVLVGDLGIAQETFDTFFSVWLMFGVLPERCGTSPW